MCNGRRKESHLILLFIEHKGRDGPTGVSTKTGLSTNADGSTASAVLVLGPGNGASGYRHGRISSNEERSGDNQRG